MSEYDVTTYEKVLKILSLLNKSLMGAHQQIFTGINLILNDGK